MSASNDASDWGQQSPSDGTSASSFAQQLGVRIAIMCGKAHGVDPTRLILMRQLNCLRANDPANAPLE